MNSFTQLMRVLTSRQHQNIIATIDGTVSFDVVLSESISFYGRNIFYLSISITLRQLSTVSLKFKIERAEWGSKNIIIVKGTYYLVQLQ